MQSSMLMQKHIIHAAPERVSAGKSIRWFMLLSTLHFTMNQRRKKGLKVVIYRHNRIRERSATTCREKSVTSTSASPLSVGQISTEFTDL